MNKKQDISSMDQELKNSTQLQLVDQAKLPIDCSDFKSILLNKMIFVDKSLLIKQIIESSYNRIIFLRPRKWGKTMNMKMLKLFFQAVVNESQDKVKVLQPNMVFFEGGQATNQNGKKVTLKKLKIANEPKWQKQYFSHQGQYPVIFLSFNFNQQQKIEKLKFFLIKQILRIYEQHKYLQCFKQLFTFNYKKLMKLASSYQQKVMERQINIQNYLLQLCSLLFQYHNRKVMIIIDNFDGSYNYILSGNWGNSYYTKPLLSFICMILNSLGKEQIHIGKIIMSGTLSFLISKGEISSTGYKTFNTLSKDFRQFYGFTKKQIQEQIIKKRYQNFSQKKINKFLQIISKQYGQQSSSQNQKDNYSFSVNQKINKPQQKIYNPYDIIRYFQSCTSEIEQGQQFWLKQKNHSLLKQILQSSSNNIQLFLKVLLLVNPFNKLNQLQSFLYGQTPTQNYLQVPKNNISQQFFTDMLINLGYLVSERKNKYYLMVKFPSMQYRNLFWRLLLQSFNSKHKENEKNVNLIPSLKNWNNFNSCFQGFIKGYQIQQRQVNKKIFQRDNCFKFIIKKLILSLQHAYHIQIQNDYAIDSFGMIFYAKQNTANQQILLLDIKHSLNTYNEDQLKNLLSNGFQNSCTQNRIQNVSKHLKQNKSIKNIIVHHMLILQRAQTERYDRNFEKVLKMTKIYTPQKFLQFCDSFNSSKKQNKPDDSQRNNQSKSGMIAKKYIKK